VFSRDIENEIAPVCRELGIGLVPYSPLGRGLLSGAISSVDDLAADDFRRTQPRWEAQNLSTNLEFVSEIRAVALKYDASPSQIALAWLLAQGEDIVPIPGTKRRHYLEESIASTDIVLRPGDLSRLDHLRASGNRYPDMTWTSRDTAAASA